MISSTEEVAQLKDETHTKAHMRFIAKLKPDEESCMDTVPQLMSDTCISFTALFPHSNHPTNQRSSRMYAVIALENTLRAS